MLNKLPKTNEKIFGNTKPRVTRGTLQKQRRKIAVKLNNPRLLRIHFHTLRHWKATMLYHQTKDILYVKQFLGHKDIDSTLLYTQLVNFEKPDQFHVKTAKTIKEAENLIKAGFEYVTTFNNTMLFRKRK
jgi:integrase